MLTFVPDYQEKVMRGLQPIWHRRGDTLDNGKHNAVYLHGEIEARAGFDIVYLAPGLGQHIVMSEAGQLLVNVQMDAGEQKAVMIYWWSKSHKNFRALICDLKDIQAVRYARQCQWNRVEIL